MFSLRKAVRLLARLGRPILRLIGVKGGTVPDKIAEGAEIIDKALDDKPQSSQ